MHQHLVKLQQGISFTGDVPTDAPAFLREHGFPKTALHSQAVAHKALELAKRFDANQIHLSPD